jgi:hypothetical protein
MAFADGTFQISVDNFKEHSAALNLQRRFREKMNYRMTVGTPTSPRPDDVKNMKNSPVSPSSAKTGGGSDGDKTTPNPNVSLPGQPAADEGELQAVRAG